MAKRFDLAGKKEQEWPSFIPIHQQTPETRLIQIFTAGVEDPVLNFSQFAAENSTRLYVRYSIFLKITQQLSIKVTNILCMLESWMKRQRFC